MSSVFFACNPIATSRRAGDGRSGIGSSANGSTSSGGAIAAGFAAGTGGAGAFAAIGGAFGAGRGGPLAPRTAAGRAGRSLSSGTFTPSPNIVCFTTGFAAGGAIGGALRAEAAASSPDPAFTRNVLPHFGQRIFRPFAGTRRSSTWYVALHDSHSTLSIATFGVGGSQSAKST